MKVKKRVSTHNCRIRKKSVKIWRVCMLFNEYEWASEKLISTSLQCEFLNLEIAHTNETMLNFNLNFLISLNCWLGQTTSQIIRVIKLMKFEVITMNESTGFNTLNRWYFCKIDKCAQFHRWVSRFSFFLMPMKLADEFHIFFLFLSRNSTSEKIILDFFPQTTEV